MGSIFILSITLSTAYRLNGALELYGRVENLTDETIVTRNQGGSIDLGTPLRSEIGTGVTLAEVLAVAEGLPAPHHLQVQVLRPRQDW